MYGVVLWNDCNLDRAVIWCEDHGDLAFYKGDGTGKPLAAGMRAGDLVSFDLCEGGEMRLAREPRLVAQDSHPSLSLSLKEAGRAMGAFPDTKTDLPEPCVDGGISNVVPFRPQRNAEVA